MKNIKTILIFIILFISCKNNNLQEQKINNVQDSLVEETVDKLYQNREELIQRQKLIYNIQQFVHKQEQYILVLGKNQVGKTFIIEAPKPFVENDHDTLVYAITYLGKSKQRQYKVIYNEVLFGPKISPHLTSNLVFYDMGNKNLGYYYIPSIPMPKLKGDSLIFRSDMDSNCSQTTIVSLKDSIPKEIFIKCIENMGDIYTFNEEY